MAPEIQLQAQRSPNPGGGGAGGGGVAAATPTTLRPSTMCLQEAVLPQPQLGGKKKKKRKDKLTLVPLIFLIYFEVSGGPYAAESSVGAAGPLLALLGFLIFPFIWSIPESLVTAELATALPDNGGFVLWADLAFGPFAGSLMGSWKFLSGVINSAAFPALCADYLARAFHSLSSGPPRYLTLAGFNLVLSFLNYTGLTIVGYTAVALGVVSLLPFVIMSGVAIPRIRPGRWGSMGARHKDWRLFFNTLFWNLNFWDNASTLAGEVENPQRTFPRALLAAGLMTCIGYLVPLLACTGALDVPQDSWTDGFFADAAGMIAGRWLKFWVEAGAVLSAVGLYEAQLSSSSFQLLGMANLSILPLFFAIRSKWFNTPWVGILVSSLITLAISFMSFDNIISSANFLYSLGMLLEFSSFLWLRRKHPNLTRPFRVPMGMPGLICMCLVPSGFLIYVMAIATWQVFVISAGMTLLGIGMHFLMAFCKSKGYMEFSKDEKNCEAEGGEDEKRAEV